MKRPFIRKTGILIDRITGPTGIESEYQMPATMLGEQNDPQDTQRFLEDLGSISRTEAASIYALSDSASKEYLDGLLKSLANGNIAAPMHLTVFVDDPRVQPALIDSVRNASLGNLSNFAQVAGLVGGVGAREILRQRLTELMDEQSTFEDAKFHNQNASSLEAVAESLLRLVPDDEHAAKALVKLFDHPCKLNRNSAVRVCAALLNMGSLSIGIARLIREKLNPLLNTPDPEALLSAASALFFANANELLDRLDKILLDSSEQIRLHAIAVLGQAPTPFPALALSLLLKHLGCEQSLRLKVEIADQLGDLVPHEDMAQLVAQALSDEAPSLRHRGTLLLQRLDGPRAQRIAEDALVDEPDEALRRLLTRFAIH